MYDTVITINVINYKKITIIEINQLQTRWHYKIYIIHVAVSLPLLEKKKSATYG